MKKLAVVIILFTILLSSAYSFSTPQRIYTVDDEIYMAIYNLFISAGYSPLFSSGPWSQAELIKMLSSIDYTTLTPSEKSLYNKINNKLNEADYTFSPDAFGFSININTALETYTHLNTSDYFQGHENWIYPYQKQLPVLSAGLGFHPFESMMIYTDFLLGKTYSEENGFGTTHFNTNIPINIATDMNVSMPYRAYVSVGGNYWNILLGRERISWGEGESGNFLIGDNFPYNNTCRFTAYNSNLKYTFLTNFYLHPQNYDIDKQHLPINGIYMFMAHRLEWRIHNKFNINLSESIIYQNETNYIDISILNPAMFFHDYYMRGNANSSITIELNYTPIRNLSLYFQGIVDEFGFGGDEYHNPNAIGLMLGTKYIHTFSNEVIAKTIVEAVYTDPYLYLRDSYDNAGFPLNFTAAFREFAIDKGIVNHINFIGYGYGNDLIAVMVKEDISKYELFNTSLSITYIAKGSKDINSQWRTITGSLLAPTTSPEEGKDAINHKIITSLSGLYYPTKSTGIYTNLGYVVSINPENKKTERTRHDLQLTLGIKIKVL